MSKEKLMSMNLWKRSSALKRTQSFVQPIFYFDWWSLDNLKEIDAQYSPLKIFKITTLRPHHKFTLRKIGYNSKRPHPVHRSPIFLTFLFQQLLQNNLLKMKQSVKFLFLFQKDQKISTNATDFRAKITNQSFCQYHWSKRGCNKFMNKSKKIVNTKPSKLSIGLIDSLDHTAN